MHASSLGACDSRPSTTSRWSPATPAPTSDFYAGRLGLRLVKKTVNFDQPTAYHLYFGDEAGHPGSLLTWFEFPGTQPGVAGDGAVHLIELGVGSPDALDFWAGRLDGERTEDSVRFRDYDGLAFAIVVGEAGPPLRAAHPEIPAEYAITGVEGARAYGSVAPDGDPLLTETLGFEHLGGGEYRLTGSERSVRWAYDRPRGERARLGAGSVHHIAWACRDEDHLAWQERARAAGREVTDVRDRDYFQVDLLPRAPRRAVRDRDDVAGVRGRRGSRAPGRGAAPAPPA